MLPGLVVGILLVWLVVITVAQAGYCGFTPWQPSHGSGLLPRWTFFAPHPVFLDLNLWIRHRHPQQKLTPWYEIPIAPPRHSGTIFWNPKRRIQKPLYSALLSIFEMKRRKNHFEIIAASSPYQVILDYIRSRERPADEVEAQFMVVYSGGFFPRREPKQVFLSGVHDL